MSSDDETMTHGCDRGAALVYQAQDTGDWKPVVDWLLRYPDRFAEFARLVKEDGAVRGAVTTSRPSFSDLTGVTIGGAELHELAGKGSSAWVFRGYQPALKRQVAVKLIHSGDPARFRVEAERVAGLQHPNIVEVYEFGETERGPYLVMPLLTASLDEYRRAQPGGRLPERDAARLVRDIALGIHHAHQRGLIHRDLKPLNVLLDEDGTPKVADFGLARPIDGTATVGVAGTYGYMAPEQAGGERGLTTAVDVWALGVTLFELLTGRLPFGGGPAAAPRVIADPAPRARELAPDVSADLEAVCLKCMEKQPDARYATARAVADELDRFLRGEPVQARPPGFWDWLRQLARKRLDPQGRASWPISVWFGLWAIAGPASVYALVRTGAPAAGVWVVNGVSAAGMLGALWWYALRRFRYVPAADRHSLIIAAGTLLTYVPLLAAYVPLSLSAPARDGLALYPLLTALSGLGFFTLGSTHWSRFFLIGAAIMACVPLTVWWPEESPLLYGAVVGGTLWYYALAKRRLGPPAPIAA